MASILYQIRLFSTTNIIKTQETCSALPLPTLTHHTSQQWDFLPRKLQKQWKKHLSTYHLIRKAIYITKTIPLWQNHPVTQTLNPKPLNPKPIQIANHNKETKDPLSSLKLPLMPKALLLLSISKYNKSIIFIALYLVLLWIFYLWFV
jgi:hypothetical protein